MKFDEKLELSVKINMLGTKRLVELCHRMLSLDVSAFHVKYVIYSKIIIFRKKENFVTHLHLSVFCFRSSVFGYIQRH